MSTPSPPLVQTPILLMVTLTKGGLTRGQYFVVKVQQATSSGNEASVIENFNQREPDYENHTTSYEHEHEHHHQPTTSGMDQKDRKGS